MKKEATASVDNLQERFKTIEPNLQILERSKELLSLQSQIQAVGFWNNQKEAQKITKQAAHLENYLENWKNIEGEIGELKDMITQSADDEEAALFEEDIRVLNKKFEQGEVDVLLSEEYDKGNAILSLHVGNGGQDAEDFCQMLFRMYGRYAENQEEWKVQILDESRSDVGLKSVMIEVHGFMAYGRLKSEHGVHRLIRLSPFNAKSLRQTSFARVEVLPEIDADNDEVQIQEKDLRVDVFRASGNGGQSVNTTDSAVRITYIPLNIVVTCQNEKSQLQNKESALKVLRSRLMKLKLEQQAQKIEELRGDVMENSFGSQIRTYTLQPYKLVKDHRTNAEHSNPEKVFDGDLDVFIEAYLRQH